MGPVSAIYYLKQNKKRAGLMIFMLFFTCLMYLAGNYVDSINFYRKKGFEYSEKIAMISASSNDKDFVQYTELIEELKKDEKLTVLLRSGGGFIGYDWTCTLGWDMGSVSYIFNSAEDMGKAFDRLGIKCDMSEVKNKSIVISSAFAKNIGLKKGDKIEMEKITGYSDGFASVDAVIDDGSYIMFMVCEDNNRLFRAYIMSDEMEGETLYSYITEKIGDRPIHLSELLEKGVDNSLSPISMIFMIAAVMLSLILSVTANAVITGQYIKRTYEFGVYRAIGMPKKKIRAKIASEILLMDLFAIVIGAAVIFTASFMLNELVYKPVGQYLPYYSWQGLICFLISNLMVTLPMILTKCHMMSKADVTEF